MEAAPGSKPVPCPNGRAETDLEGCAIIHNSLDGVMARKPRLYRTRDLIRRLEMEGWVARSGRGDHVVFKHPEKPGRVTVDTGVKEIPIGTLRSIYRMAGWKW
jgi:predicted RNA binding protein YcfA (HicA-like mRNA interferase family)